MRVLLVTGHRFPRFYSLNGEIVEAALNYVEKKTFSYVDEEGQLVHQQLTGSTAIVLNHWMVDSVEKALCQLSESGVYPFKNKNAAKEHAKRLGLQSFKYLPVP